MISSVDLFGWGGTDEDWLKTAVLDPETAREFDSLLTTRDLSADRSDILLFLYGRAYESDLADARWPDESAFWEALERSDPVGVIARVSGLGRPVRSRSRTRVDYARLAQCVLDARGATGIHPLRTLRHCWDPA